MKDKGIGESVEVKDRKEGAQQREEEEKLLEKQLTEEESKEESREEGELAFFHVIFSVHSMEITHKR